MSQARFSQRSYEANEHLYISNLDPFVEVDSLEMPEGS